MLMLVETISFVGGFHLSDEDVCVEVISFSSFKASNFKNWVCNSVYRNWWHTLFAEYFQSTFQASLSSFILLCVKLVSTNCVNLTSLPFNFWLGWPMEGIKRRSERKRDWSVYFFGSSSEATVCIGWPFLGVQWLFSLLQVVVRPWVLHSFVISLNCLSFVSSPFIQQSSIIPFEWAVSCCAIVTKGAENGRKGGSVSSWVSSSFTQYPLEIR